MDLTISFTHIFGALSVAGIAACVRLLWTMDKNLAVFAERLASHIEHSEQAITKLNGRVYRLERRVRQ